MLLLIPGPVATRPEVRDAARQQIAPWDPSFRPLYADVRARVMALSGARDGIHAALPLQGSGHFAIEAAIRGLVPAAGGKLLIPDTGSYAQRMARLARESGRAVAMLPTSPVLPLAPDTLARALADDPSVTHVGLVQSETSSGVIHDAEALGAVVRAAGRRLILDAVSAFGAIPLDLAAHPELDAAVFTANKCLEGLAGISFVLARAEALRAARGGAGSWTLDLCDILETAERDNWGSFRFTPPAQVFAALRTALHLHAAEGGQHARLSRYRENAAALFDGLHGIGLRPYLDASVQGPIVLNAHAPADPRWSLADFVTALKRRGFVISNFYNTDRPSFRVGCIGAVTPADMRRFLRAVDSALRELGIRARGPGEADSIGSSRRPYLVRDIVARRPRAAFAVASAEDFAVSPAYAADAEIDLDDMLPYCLDAEHRRLVFTVMPDLAASAAAPFLYQAQYAGARRLVCVPLERLDAIAAPAALAPLFVLSVSRCGTTLLARLLRGLGQASVSEPDVYTQVAMLAESPSPALPRDGLLALTRACTLALARSLGASVAIKLRDHCNTIAAELAEAVPEARFAFLLRDSRSWARSRHRAFNDPPRALADILYRGVMAFDALARRGAAPMLVWYEDLVAEPRAILARLGVPPTALAAEATLARLLAQDAQADTDIARDRPAGAPLADDALREFARLWSEIAPRDVLRRHGMERLLMQQ
jgi:2-aminoethylphosphonate-pyruvate transaminase